MTAPRNLTVAELLGRGDDAAERPAPPPPYRGPSRLTIPARQWIPADTFLRAVDVRRSVYRGAGR